MHGFLRSNIAIMDVGIHSLRTSLKRSIPHRQRKWTNNPPYLENGARQEVSYY